MKSETIDESKYPMTYEEYEKRVIELFLTSTDSPHDFCLLYTSPSPRDA